MADALPASVQSHDTPTCQPQKREVASKHTRPGHLFPSMAHEGSGRCPAPHWCPGSPLLFLVTVALIISLLAAEVQPLVWLSLLCFPDASIQHPSLCFPGTICLAEDSGSGQFPWLLGSCVDLLAFLIVWHCSWGDVTSVCPLETGSDKPNTDTTIAQLVSQ